MFPLDQIEKSFTSVIDLEEVNAFGSGTGAAPGEPLGETGAAPVPPPILLGGLDWQKPGANFVGVDWLTFSVPLNKVIPLAKYISVLFGDPEIRDYGRFSYQAQCVWESVGVGLYFDKSTDYSFKMHRGKGTCVLPGKFWSLFDGAGAFQLIKTIVFDFFGVASRIDVNFDDYDRIKTPSQLLETCEQGNFSGFRSFHPDQRFELTSTGSVLVGDMISFGRRGKSGGGKYLRCYDKNLESDGVKNCIRWELELSQEKAKGVLLKLACASSLGEFSGRVAGLIGACITFLERAPEGHLDRMAVLSWWEEIVNRLGCCFFSGAEKVVTVEKSKEWIENQVSSSLALVRRAFGDAEYKEWILNLVMEGEKRHKKRHKAALRLYHQQVEVLAAS